MMGGLDLAQFLSFAAMAAIIAVAMLQLRERFPTPAYLIAGGAGLKLLSLVLRMFVRPPTSSMFETTVCYALVLAGLILILDQRFPTRGYLPATLTKHRSYDRSEMILPILVALFGVGGILSSGARFGGATNPRTVTEILALVLSIGGWIYFRRTYFPLHWVLQRRPEAVVWVFVQQTRVTRNGVYQGTHWTTQVALENGELLAIGGVQSDCEMMAAEIAHVCPQAALGYSDENRGRFAMNPASLRKTPPTQGG